MYAKYILINGYIYWRHGTNVLKSNRCGHLAVVEEKRISYVRPISEN